ncbi:kinase-like domain-containing protein [Dactylonectria macrodidyma]|uniref:non-specific serine/threonine protein kinase n=1 Tax=Dactylonectria macrodidyma TaxID=307937 RepID=A0A9P9J492_9HYPO|nr:kinase-like domain-containing protein [Dactylonectria macrodidyma]
MADSTSNLVLALRLETEFLAGCVRHTGPLQGPPAQTETRTETWQVEQEIGRGTFGTVRFEKRRHSASSVSQVRAVKEVSKMASFRNRWDFLRELKAMAEFSQPKYSPYFVRTYGWFENSESIFIAMEFFPLGDLRRSMDTRPPFPESAASQIVRQLTRGINFMHQEGFAHRDLKPANILVVSRQPQWLVKIADFGISKQAVEGGTDLRTMGRGTLGYMAPETMGFFRSDESIGTYSVTVDVWAVGVIAVELLLKKLPFRDLADVSGYLHGVVSLDLGGVDGVDLSPPCRDFLRGLLTPSPVTRPTASAALIHPWLAEPGYSVTTEESMFVEDDSQRGSSELVDTIMPVSPPSQAWSTLLSTYHGPGFDMSILVPRFRNISIDTTRYFILRSDNPIDIETSVAHCIWTSSPRVNKILDKGYGRANGQVILFFSVIGSRKFCGVSRMTSAMDWDNTDEHWVEDSWRGRFTLEWLCLVELSFDRVKHIPVKETTPKFLAISCYDGTEIVASSAYELLKEFSSAERDEQTQRLLTQPSQ